jgi:hypothetical protein
MSIGNNILVMEELEQLIDSSGLIRKKIFPECHFSGIDVFLQGEASRMPDCVFGLFLIVVFLYTLSISPDMGNTHGGAHMNII